MGPFNQESAAGELDAESTSGGGEAAWGRVWPYKAGLTYRFSNLESSLLFTNASC